MIPNNYHCFRAQVCDDKKRNLQSGTRTWAADAGPTTALLTGRATEREPPMCAAGPRGPRPRPPEHALCRCCCRARRSGWLPPTFISASHVVPVWQKGGRGGNVTRSPPRPPPACAQHFAAASFGSHKPPRSRLQPCSSERMWQRRHYARRGSDNDK